MPLIKQSGFTMIELMVVVAVVAVLAAIAAPDLSAFLTRSQRRAATGDFLASMALARSEAIKRGAPVRIQSLGTGALSMQNGWIMFVDADGLGTVPSSGSPLLIERKDAYPAGQLQIGCAALTDSGTAPEYLRFDGLGRVVRANGSAGAGSIGFTVLRNSVSKQTATVVVDWGGRSRVIENQLPAGC